MTDTPVLNRGLYTIFPVWLLIGVFLVVALIHEKTEMALLCLAALLVVHLAWIWSRYLRSGLSFEVGTDRQRVFPGEAYTLELTVGNAKMLPAWVRAAPPTEFSTYHLNDDGDGSLNTALRWHETAHFKWDLRAGPRGVYRVGPGQIMVGDLLGFFPRVRPSGAGLELIVFPRLVPVAPLEFAKLDFFGAPMKESPVDDPVYLWGTRDYQPGRPARFIHWRASARHQRWQEKLFEPSAQAKIVLVLAAADFVEAGDRPGFERAIEVLASLAEAYNRRGIRVDLTTDAPLAGDGPGEAVVSDRPMPLTALLERLARVRFRAGRPVLEELIGRPGRLSRANVVYFSRRFDRAAAEAQAYFNHRGVPATFVVNQADRAESSGPTTGRERLHLLSEVGPEAEA